ncbi:hypothetical protein [Geobacter anodireducens]
MKPLVEANQAQEPRLWIRRIALFKSSEEREPPIRNIPLHRGLNIIWGVELPDDAGTNDAHPVTLSGHSVGKTTLCRLIRYCLGESNYGNPAAMSRIKTAFPGGWVGMELTVDGQKWSVLKPIGRSGDSKATQDAVVESLFDLERKENNYGDFMTYLRNAMMSGLRASCPPNSEKPYDWKHLLAWLTRDQEARFQSLHDWRSTRSKSDTPKFESPKEHALYLIRLVLDLVQDKEIEASRALAENQAELNQLETDITDLRREPEYRFNEQERALKQVLNLPSGQPLNIDESDLTSPLFLRRSDLNRSLFSIQTDIENIDQKMAEKRIWLASYDEQRRLFKDVKDITEEATESLGSKEQEDDTIQKLRALRGKDCSYGDVLFSECSYIQGRLTKSSQLIDLTKKREERRVASVTETRQTIADQQHEEHDKIILLLNELREKLKEDIKEKTRKEMELAGIRAQCQLLDHHLEQRKSALDLIEGRVPNTKLESESARATDLREKISLQKRELESMLTSYSQRLKVITSVYDALIKKALSDTYSGELRLKGELQFNIEETTGLSGEAVETLALVLADVSAVICSCQGIGYHPRFLLHDSPREADLDRHIYNRYLEAMWTVTDDYGGTEKAPFQYIVTTTSRPPKKIESSICVELKAHPETEMLFTCRLKNSTTPYIPDLFENQEVLDEGA